jgi:carboxymethylenebutenolidase
MCVSGSSLLSHGTRMYTYAMLKYPVFLVLIIIIAGGYYLVNYLQDAQTQTPQATEGIIDVRGENVAYFENRQGYCVEPTQGGNYPGVVMIHEWWGLNEHVKAQADELAKNGYRVLAVDLFGTVATTADQARAQVSSLDQAKALENLKAAEKYLRDKGSQKIASLGWCFGGGQSLQLALAQDENLDATVIYYGTSLVTDRDRLRNIDWPVLGIFGEVDQSIPTTTVYAFRDSLVQLGIENSIHVYPGVGHAFANPSNAGFAPQETADAWAKTLAFLDENLK